MTLDGFLAAFLERLHNLATFIASTYIACVFWGVFIAGTSGYDLLGKILKVLGFDSATNWAASVADRIEKANAYEAVHVLLGIWLIVSLIFFVVDYAGTITGNLLPQSAISTAFFWCILTDFFYQGSIWGLHTLAILVAVGFIIFHSREFGKEFWVPSVMAAVALIVSPLYAVLAIPFWLASKTEPSEIAKSTNRVVSELEKLREAIDRKRSSGEFGKR
ncbi:hypothetical protein [Corynebacterium phoceense]|uniref:hypothetical protein n=1 Tax=Corynebacterium phoceense TaxID=1686286 RepID=UPI00211CB38A|nr:hypothetical protein [Corynebacterium phoceense]MCQ9332084.1 hypothetical protein [Corynebacterium phoceense]